MKYNPHFIIKSDSSEKFEECSKFLKSITPVDAEAIFTNAPLNYPEGLSWNIGRFSKEDNLKNAEAIILIDAEELLANQEKMDEEWVRVRIEAFSAFPSIAYIGKNIKNEDCTDEAKKKILFSMRKYTYISDDDFDKYVKDENENWKLVNKHGVSFNSKALDSLNGFRMFTDFPVFEAQINLLIIGYEFLPIQ